MDFLKRALGEHREKPVAKSFIAGQWVEGKGRIFEVKNPSTDEVIGYCHDCDEEQVKGVFRAAKESQPYWFLKVSILEKEAIYRRVEELLEKYRPQIVHLLNNEMGKIAVTADADVTEFIHCVQHYWGELSRVEGGTKDTQMLDKDSSYRREPLGTVLAICPWNFFAIPSWKIFGSITGGNACVLKISKETPFMGTLAVAIINQAIKEVLGKEKYENLKGLVQIVQGRGSTTGELLLEQGKERAYDLVAFTGGVETGRHIAEVCGKYLIQPHLELGGHGTIIFLDDFPIEKGVGEIVLAAFGDAGQRCVTTKEVLIEESVFDEVVAKVIEKAKKLRIGYPHLVETNLGPLVSVEQRGAIHAMVLETMEKATPIIGGYPIIKEALARAKEEGLNLGKEFFEDPRILEGAFYAPTIFVNAPRDALAMHKEIFGPVLCLTKLPKMADKQKVLELAAKIINEKHYGLSNSVLTNNARLRYLAGKLVKTGILYRGRGTTGAELGQYFGGVGLSGWGREGRGIESFTYLKQIYDDYYPEVRLAQVGAADKLKKMIENSKPLF